MNSLPTSHRFASVPPGGRRCASFVGSGSLGSGNDPSWSGVLRRQSQSRRPYDVSRLASEDSRTLSISMAEDRLSETVDDDPRKARMRAEAVLLVSKSPLSPRKLASLASLPDATSARTAVRSLNELYDRLGRAIRVETIAGGYRLMTRSNLAPWLSRLSHLPSPLRLSTPMLETLSVVAYRQPVSRADAEAIRGVACGELLRQLMDRDLVRIAGRSEELGRPYLYGTTKHFLQIFGLPNTDSLPPIRWQTLTDDSDTVSPKQDVAEENSPEDHAVILDCLTETASEVIDTRAMGLVDAEFASPEILSDDSIATATEQAATDDPKNVIGNPTDDPKNVIEDEEDDLYEGETEGDWDDDDWDDPDDEDDDEEDDDDDADDKDDDSDDDDDDDDGLEDDDWEEVDDEDSDEDIDDDEELDEAFDDEEEDDDWGSDDDDDKDDEDDDDKDKDDENWE